MNMAVISLHVCNKILKLNFVCHFVCNLTDYVYMCGAVQRNHQGDIIGIHYLRIYKYIFLSY